MNGPLNFSADALAQEAITLQQKLAAGLQTLPAVEDVHYGATTKQEVWRDGKVVLYRFVGEHKPTAKVPLLIAYALVNRPYMVDLQADRSLVKGLLARGEDVYIIDWGYPDRSDRFLMLDDYINLSSAARSITCAAAPAWTPSTCSGSARAVRFRCAMPRCIRKR